LSAVIFDLDDTLYPEQAFVESGLRAVAEWASDQFKLDRAAVAAELTHIHMQHVSDTFNRWLSAHRLSESEWVAPMVQTYREHIPVISPFPEVPAVLDQLRKSYSLGIITDGHLRCQQNKLQALGIAAQFDAIVFSDRWGRAHWKPAPFPYQQALSELGAHPSRSVYVGDNPHKDFLGARQTGMWTIRVRRRGGIHHRAEAASPDRAPHLEIASLTRLTEAITEVERSLLGGRCR
jgi:putative hydrolase of the HAD superfamily